MAISHVIRAKTTSPTRQAAACSNEALGAAPAGVCPHPAWIPSMAKGASSPKPDGVHPRWLNFRDRGYTAAALVNLHDPLVGRREGMAETFRPGGGGSAGPLWFLSGQPGGPLRTGQAPTGSTARCLAAWRSPAVLLAEPAARFWQAAGWLGFELLMGPGATTRRPCSARRW